MKIRAKRVSLRVGKNEKEKLNWRRKAELVFSGPSVY